MGYPEQMSLSNCLKRKSNADDTAINLAAAAASYAGFAVLRPISVKRLLFFVTTQVTASLTAPVVSFLAKPTYGSTNAQTTLGTLTIPTGSVVGTTVYKDISDATRLAAGSELSLNGQTQAVDSGTAAGGGWFGMLWEDAPDADLNNTALVKSV